MGLPESKRQSMEWKHTDSSVNKMFRAQLSVTKIMLTILWDRKRSIIVDFLEKVATVNSASYCKHLRQNLAYLLNDLLIDR